MNLRKSSISCLIGGKPITPNDINDSLLNGNTQINGHSPENGALATETVTKTEVIHSTRNYSFLLRAGSHLSFCSIRISGVTEPTKPIDRKRQNHR